MTYIHRANETDTLLAEAAFLSGTRDGMLTSQLVDPGYTDLDVEYAAEDRTFWCYLNPQDRPSFTPGLIRDLYAMQRSVVELLRQRPHGEEAPIRYFVLASRTPGVFNLGGDLTLFAKAIRAGNREELRSYAYGCVEAGYLNSVGYGANVVTIALSQGDALGGGWECQMSCDVLIAERRARFGLPEILFNMFPGMGASSYLTRRLGVVQAEKIIMSGKVYTAEEMLALGAIDLVVEDGEGVQEVRRYIQRNAGRHNAHSAIYGARRRAAPVTLEELRDIADIWVDAAFRLQEPDLRRMAHIAAAQDRNRRRIATTMAATVPAVAAE